MPWFKEILSRRSCGSCFFTRVWWTCSPQSLKSLYHFKMTIIVYWYLMGVRLFCWNIFVGLTRWHYIVGRKSLAICSIIFGNNVFFKKKKKTKQTRFQQALWLKRILETCFRMTSTRCLECIITSASSIMVNEVNEAYHWNANSIEGLLWAILVACWSPGLD